MTEWLMAMLACGAFPLAAYMFSLCCCGSDACTNCSTSTDSFQVDIIDVLSGTCTNCEVFNDTWIVDRTNPLCGGSLTNCVWAYSQSSPLAGCTEAGKTECAIAIRVSMFFTAINFQLVVQPAQCQDPLPTGCGARAAITYSLTSTPANPDCSAFSALDIPYSSSPSGFCDGSSSTCTVTAL